MASWQVVARGKRLWNMCFPVCILSLSETPRRADTNSQTATTDFCSESGPRTTRWSSLGNLCTLRISLAGGIQEMVFKSAFSLRVQSRGDIL
jgi:hypothetical protein